MRKLKISWVVDIVCIQLNHDGHKKDTNKICLISKKISAKTYLNFVSWSKILECYNLHCIIKLKNIGQIKRF